MSSETTAMSKPGAPRQTNAVSWWSGLQARMMISYVAATLVFVLLLEMLVSAVVYLAVTRSPLADAVISYAAQQTAQVYALEAAVQAGDAALDPHSTFQPGQPSSLALPDTPVRRIPLLSLQVPFIAPGSTPSGTASFALLVNPDGQVVASSYPARYAPSSSVTPLLPDQKQLVLDALAGKPGVSVADTADDRIAYAAQTVWNKEHKPLGAVYVQESLALSSGGFLAQLAGGWARSATGWLIIMLPVGALFGFLTTRSLVRRIRRLETATTQFADGDYTRRVRVSGKDEIGQLEHHFNEMADQLVESMAQRQVLTEQAARQAERARIDQELRTAEYIQRALLPKEAPTPRGWRLAPFYQPARIVGGDFYDFLPLDAGRWGIVIGDVTGKGVPAALVMATTCTMLRAAAQKNASPGQVLAQVNELLLPHIPSGMFATCFFALFDPEAARLRYANAGHDLPYCRYNGGVKELRATGMPLGLMPDMDYEEQEATLAPEEYILFYSDGLVEAHNPAREMFGLPRLNRLIQEHADGASIIDFLLAELKQFTGKDWEQEDDVTLVTLRAATPDSGFG
jgi:serine phosphatase RsbU (regulator of sigma subunit)